MPKSVYIYVYILSYPKSRNESTKQTAKLITTMKVSSCGGAFE